MDKLRWFMISGAFDRVMLAIVAILLLALILVVNSLRDDISYRRDICGSRYDPCRVIVEP